MMSQARILNCLSDGYERAKIVVVNTLKGAALGTLAGSVCSGTGAVAVPAMNGRLDNPWQAIGTGMVGGFFAGAAGGFVGGLKLAWDAESPRSNNGYIVPLYAPRRSGSES